MSVLTLRRSLRLALAKSDIYAKHRDKLVKKLEKDRLFGRIATKYRLRDGLNESNVVDILIDRIEGWAGSNNVNWGLIKPYVKWIIITYAKDGIKLYEDISAKALPELVRFDKIKKKLPGNKRDINRLKKLDDLMDIVEEYEKQSAEDDLKNQEELDEQFEKNGDIEWITDDSKYSVWKLLTRKGSCYLGKGSRWCTAIERDDNAFESYDDYGDLYVIRDDKKYENSTQLFLPVGGEYDSVDYMDVRDNPVSIKTIPKKIFKAILEHHIDGNQHGYMVLTGLFNDATEVKEAGWGKYIQAIAEYRLKHYDGLDYWFTNSNLNFKGMSVDTSSHIELLNDSITGANFKGAGRIDVRTLKQTFGDGEIKFTFNKCSFGNGISIGYAGREVKLKDCKAHTLTFSTIAEDEPLDIFDCDIKTLDLKSISHIQISNTTISKMLATRNVSRGLTIRKSTIQSNDLDYSEWNVWHLIGGNSIEIFNNTIFKDAVVRDDIQVFKDHIMPAIGDLFKEAPNWELKGTDLVINRLDNYDNYRGYMLRDINAILDEFLYDA